MKRKGLLPLLQRQRPPLTCDPLGSVEGCARKPFFGSLRRVARMQIIHTNSTIRITNTTAPAMPPAMYVKSLFSWKGMVRVRRAGSNQEGGSG